jgi:hypothetical protein
MVECNDSDVATSTTVTFEDDEFEQEETIKMGNNNDADDLTLSDLVTYHYLFLASPSLAVKVFLFLVLPSLSFNLLLA